MFNKHQKALLLFGCIIFLFGVIPSCSLDETENVNINSEQYFSFDPQLIHLPIKQSDKPTFSLIEGESKIQDLSESEVVNWKQNDYANITEELHKLIWNEFTKNWKLYYVYFSVSCDQVNSGFQFAQFKFFQIKNMDGQEVRVEHVLEIDLLKHFAHAMEIEYSPNLENRRGINIETIKPSTDEALAIAEKDGGKEKRTAINNKCGVSVGNSLDTTNSNWLVIYSPGVFIDRISFN